jgi:hypothetical protein
MPTDSFDERVAELDGDGDARGVGTDRTRLALMQCLVTMHGSISTPSPTGDGDPPRHE